MNGKNLLSDGILARMTVAATIILLMRRFFDCTFLTIGDDKQTGCAIVQFVKLLLQSDGSSSSRPYPVFFKGQVIE